MNTLLLLLLNCMIGSHFNPTINWAFISEAFCHKCITIKMMISNKKKKKMVVIVYLCKNVRKEEKSLKWFHTFFYPLRN